MAAFLPDSDSEDELPPAWEERATLDGSVFFVNHVTKATQWTHPRTGKKKIVSGELPQGWARRVDATGDVLYEDLTLGRTTHTDPRLAFAQEVTHRAMDLRQRFDGSSTALQVLLGCDLSGKTILVTGATTGIGLETARALALHGAHVIVSGRSLASCQVVQNRIEAEKSTARVSVVAMDLTSLSSVRSGAARIRLSYPVLDVVILNAGVMGVGWQLTEDGLDELFQVNFLAQFYLTLLIEPCLRRNSRVVIVSSESHRYSTITPASLSLEKLSPSTGKGYWDIMAYNHSKLCNALHVLELSRRLAPRGTTVMAVHPGNLIHTDLSRRSCLYRLLFGLARPFTKSLQQGAACTVYCAVAPELASCNGAYFNNCWLAKASDTARNPLLASALWDLAVDLLRQKEVPLPDDSPLLPPTLTPAPLNLL